MLTGGRAGPRLQPLCMCGGPQQWPSALVRAEQTCDRLVQSRSLVDGATASPIPVRPHGHLVSQLPEAMVPHCHAPSPFISSDPGFPGSQQRVRCGASVWYRAGGPRGTRSPSWRQVLMGHAPTCACAVPWGTTPPPCPWLSAPDLHLPLGPPRPVSALPAPASAGVPASPACTGGDQAQRWAQPLSTLARLFPLPLHPRLCN